MLYLTYLRDLNLKKFTNQLKIQKLSSTLKYYKNSPELLLI